MASDTLPVPARETRPYIRVQPAADPVASGPGLAAQLRRLHSLGYDAPDGLRDRLFGGSTPATIECLIVAPGDGTLAYLFGIDDPDRIDALDQVLQTVFPNTYECTQTRLTLAQLGLDTEPDSGDRVTAVEYRGHVDRPQDWQTQLTPFAEMAGETAGRPPLASLCEAVAATDATVVYQALLRRKPDWTAAAAERERALRSLSDTPLDQLTNALLGNPAPDTPVPVDDETRMAEIAARHTQSSFEVAARAVVIGTDPTQPARELTGLFASVGRTCYQVDGHRREDTAATQVHTAIRDRTLPPSTFDRRHWRPWGPAGSPTLVVDVAELPSFLLIDGPALTTAGIRVTDRTPGERTGLPLPPPTQLETYRAPGFTLGYPRTADGTNAPAPVAVPPSLQPLHTLIAGKTGSGKSVTGLNALIANRGATEGASLIIEPKGDDFAIDYLRAHYATYGTLANVLYFECSEWLPAVSFFDIRDDLAAGRSRASAVEDRVDHYIEILTAVMGRERFEQATRSPDIIRYLVKALFDPASGADAFSHRELHMAAQQLHERQTTPPVSDPDLERLLSGVVANRARSFDDIMKGVENRIEKIPVDQRLARMFNHVAEPGAPQFDIADYLNEDVTIVFALGGVREEAKRVLLLVILSNLWSALKRRQAHSEGPHPLVTCYIEEAASVAASALLRALLAQSRSFGLAMTLALQYPAQLEPYDDGVYNEVLNNISAYCLGNVPADRRLAERLAHDELPPQAVADRLRALSRGEWLCTLPAPFGEPEPRPFLLESGPLPPGAPEGPRPLSAGEAEAFEEAFDTVCDHTRATAGLTLELPQVAGQTPETDAEAQPSGEEMDDDTAPAPRVDSALPYTNRMPGPVRYNPDTHALECTTCQTRYDPTIEGMRRAIACDSTLAEVTRDDVPVCELNLKLSAAERAVSEWSDQQLLFIQAVYNAQQLRYDPLEYDLLWDSMLRLQEYLDIDSPAVQDLVDAGLLSHDTDHPHRLYSVTPDGRKTIGEHYRQGVDYGHGAGDLDETSLHVLAVEVGRRYLVQEYRENPDSPVAEVVAYYDLDDNHRLDVAGLDETGTVIVAVEAERVNHDLRRAAPSDFDKMAACEVKEAIWIVMTQADGHTVLEALADPLDGEPRIDTQTYARTTPPQQVQLDTPGLTAMYPLTWVRDRLESSDGS